jgi:GTP-binding protein
MSVTSAQDIRNIAIIAHVDHGKTTLVDQVLKQAGAFRANQVVAERAMDSMDLEREKGITIKAKNTSVHWKDKIINIVDTPGHADFGGEVERVMRMVDGVLLLVDAVDGPQAQTRFVLRKALQEGLRPIVIINKIDREYANPKAIHDKVLELFLELHATEEQFHAPFLYASGRDGFAMRELTDARGDLTPLFETILEHIRPPHTEEGAPFQMLVSNIDWNDYVGRIAIGKILSGTVSPGDTVWVSRSDGRKQRAKITKVFEYTGLGTCDTERGGAGNIIGLAGFEDIDIGDTVAALEEQTALPFVAIDPPTVQMEILVNDGPLAGKEGKFVTSRQIRDRLMREAKINISLKITESPTNAGGFVINARGAMQIAVLVEQMRREGFELLVSRPTVITKQDDNCNILEPIETAWFELPTECLGALMQSLANRKGRIDTMEQHATTVLVEATIPTRGLIGMEFELMNMTSGRAVLSHLFKSYEPYMGEIVTRITGTLVSIAQGMATEYTLDTLQTRGKLFITHGDEVYEGMLVGENPRTEDLPVNPTKEKQLSNVRSSGEGKGPQLTPPMKFTLERALEYIQPDEYVEITPKSIRMRKRLMKDHERKRESKKGI